jgi:hypothetical protein
MNDLPILSFNPQAASGEVGVNLDILIESRALIQANSGGGKSHLIRSLLEQTHGRIQQLMFDPEGEFATIREKFPFVLAGVDGDLETRVETAESLCRKFLELGFSLVVDMSELDFDDKREYMRRFCDEMMRVRPRPGNYPPVLVIIDELQVFVEEGSKDSCTRSVISFTNRGRKRGYGVVGATQRLSLINKNVAAALTTLFIGRTRLDNDVKRAVTSLAGDREHGKQLPRLAPGEFFAYGPAISDPDNVILVKTPPVLTTHHKVGSYGTHTPPPPEELLSVLAALSELPHESPPEEEKEHAHSAHRLRLEKPKVVESIVHVPVLDSEQAAHLQTYLDEMKALTQGVQSSLSRLQSQLNLCARQQESVAPNAARVTSPQEKPDTLPTALPASPPAQPRPSKMTERNAAPTPKPRTSGRTVKRIREELPIAAQRLIDALAEFDKAGLPRVHHANVAVKAGYAPRTGGFNQAVIKARELGLLTDLDGTVYLQLTDTGFNVAQAGDAVDFDELRNHGWMSRLQEDEQPLFQMLLASYPQSHSLGELAKALGVPEQSGGYKVHLRSLQKHGVVEATSEGRFKAADLVFPERSA